MKRKLSGSAIPRHYIFILKDGTYVVQWVERKVQDVLTGKFRPYKRSDFGHWITDAELDKLQAAGRVEHYTQRYVWMYPLPTAGRFGGQLETLKGSPHRIRAFYISTSLPPERLKGVESVLNKLSLSNPITVKVHDGVLAIFGDEDQPLVQLEHADSILQQMTTIEPEMFKKASVAVYELALGRQTVNENAEFDTEISLENVLQSISDTSVTAGRHVVLVGDLYIGEMEALESLLVDDMQMRFTHCDGARDAVPLLEDEHPDLMLMDLDLPDMHGWALIRSIRENRSLDDLPIIIISDNPSDDVFALKVARVAAFVSRPLRMRKLREKIWMALRDAEDTPLS